ncbi:hypothetical protein COOONC_10538 [Cooperia oncophora]
MKDMLQRRQENRKQPAGTSKVEAEMLAIARKGMESDEATFSVEQPLEAQSHLWSDKYRPRKPTYLNRAYLNRVQTGFDWNKYNQTHYDMDNPPPKIVQGYKFNIFYPDLLDPSTTPSFTVTPCDDPDFAVLRFKVCAGPPYEDIAFKCVNREWEMSLKDNLLRLLFTVNDTGFILVSAAVFLVDAVITFFIIQKVPCIQAGHLWTYSVLHALTSGGKDIRTAQYIFMCLYLLNLLAVLRLYYKSNKIAPYVLVFLCFTGYRIHSIFVLRLFNDPIAMMFFYLAVNFFISEKWLVGCLLYSFAVGIKMNVLLFAPALFFILLLNVGVWKTALNLICCAAVQKHCSRYSLPT